MSTIPRDQPVHYELNGNLNKWKSAIRFPATANYEGRGMRF